ncbi:MAG: hypothetical protein IT579_25500, partial [Verrucomicrobia subdivision 3 bacterium]|nr:hypothetical protein [Limisphaerales bacterium]
EFNDVFRVRGAEVRQRVSKVMGFWDSDGAFEVYHGYDAAPLVTPWPRGVSRTRSSFGEFTYYQANYDYNSAVEWHGNDEDDDQTGQLVPRARDGARRFASLPLYAMVEILSGSATDLLVEHGVPLAYDGYALYSSGSGSRFGVVNGNLVSGNGVGDVASVLKDYNLGMARFAAFTDTTNNNNAKLFDEDALTKPIIVAPYEHKQVFEQAQRAKSTHVSGGAIGPADNVWAGEFELWLEPRLTGDDWYIFLTGSEFKAFFQQERQPLRDNVEDFSNSDRTRDTKVKAVMWDWRGAWGIWVPQTTVQINN